MSKKPWEDKVSEEELEEVVDADFLDDEDEFEDFEEARKRWLHQFVILDSLAWLILYYCCMYFVLCFLHIKCWRKQNCSV